MSDLNTLKATKRDKNGKGASRAVRRAGQVPAVIYGEGKDNLAISLNARDVGFTIAKGKFLAKLLNIDIDGTVTRVIPRDVQVDPVRDQPIHLDFQRIGPGSRLRVNVPVKFINELASPGLKRGGVLNLVRHEVEVTCPADAIPQEFIFDLTGLEIGRSIHISATTLPPGVKTTIIGRDFTVATIAGAVADEEKAADAAEGAAATPAAGAAAAPAAKGGAAAPAAKGGAPAAKGGAAAPAAKGAPAAKAPAKK